MPNEAKSNEHQDPEQLLKKYSAQIGDLKRELAMYDSLSSRSGVTYEPYSEQQRYEVLQQLQNVSALWPTPSPSVLYLKPRAPPA